ncbi:hypothetical protein [Samia ricini nucleopolyhedrovirus]|nr:hypothetical protein [Samia ricini nucleopolyhedrovirus]BBD51365.1 hypothetical protein [Samia ricini nucleopolyhedrovirus]BBD51517.1 hypothetical protein [Samia ricini nucleopolyhedrovirus]
MRSTISFSLAMSSRCCWLSVNQRPSSSQIGTHAAEAASRSASISTRLTAASSARAAPRRLAATASICLLRCSPTKRSKSYRHSRSAASSRRAPVSLLQRKNRSKILCALGTAILHKCAGLTNC